MTVFTDIRHSRAISALVRREGRNRSTDSSRTVRIAADGRDVQRGGGRKPSAATPRSRPASIASTARRPATISSAAPAVALAASVVLAAQIATVWVTLRASRARRAVRAVADVALAAAALAAAANLFFHDQLHGGVVAAWVSCLLYLIAPVSIVRYLVVRRVVDTQTVLGAIAAYLMAGMFFAFLYHALGLSRAQPPFFGSQGRGTLSQGLFFSFTTLTTTGYGNLVPAGNPGQTFAVLEMLTGRGGESPSPRISFTSPAWPLLVADACSIRGKLKRGHRCSS